MIDCEDVRTSVKDNPSIILERVYIFLCTEKSIILRVYTYVHDKQSYLVQNNSSGIPSHSLKQREKSYVDEINRTLFYTVLDVCRIPVWKGELESNRWQQLVPSSLVVKWNSLLSSDQPNSFSTWRNVYCQTIFIYIKATKGWRYKDVPFIFPERFIYNFLIIFNLDDIQKMFRSAKFLLFVWANSS
jgi:hypothetical protein